LATRRDQISEHVLVLAIVEAIREFVEIEWTLPRTYSPRAWPTVSCGIPARTNL
jgi:hypothetical protein